MGARYLHFYWPTGSFKQWHITLRNRFYFVAISKRLIQKKDEELENKETVKKHGGDRTELSGRLRNHSPEDRNRYSF
jgi:hypothetical protein